jgi:hypothetical protein
MKEMIERDIVIGLITSTEYSQQFRKLWDIRLLESSVAKRIASWCLEYFDKYNEAPNKNMQAIFYQRIHNGLPKEIAEEIEQDILPNLSSSYEQQPPNMEYLLDRSKEYFKERRLLLVCAQIQDSVMEGQLEEAEKFVYSYKSSVDESSTDINLHDPSIVEKVEKAFNNVAQGLIKYPGALGDFWNRQLVRGAFVALMATEKRGKTFWLLDLAIRACKQLNRVAFIQAGDMTDDQQLRRIAVYLTKRSDIQKYSGLMYEPISDCYYNQTDDCDRSDRVCDHGVFEGRTIEELRRDITLSELIEEAKNSPAYKPCSYCSEYQSKPWGVPWVVEVDTGDPLTVVEAQNEMRKFFVQNTRQLKLSSHANGTLTVRHIATLLNNWERQDGFVPDVIIVDYADLLTVEAKTEFRHQQNEIWKQLRSLSQERHALVITATQADAKSYEQNRLKMANFSEDKRKYAHVTAMYGLNQDTKDREKRIGIMRLNEIVVREGDFSSLNEVTVLQNLRRGRPFIGSYW